MKYELIVDEKISVWRRNYVIVEADSLEEASKECLNFSDKVDIEDYDYILEAEEELNPGDVIKGFTVEVMDRNFKSLATNERR